MTVVLVLLAMLFVLELCLYLPFIWSHRLLPASVILAVLAADSGALMVAQWSLVGGLIVLIALYRLFNLLRVAASKAASQRLHRVCLRTSLWLASAQLVLILVWFGVRSVDLDSNKIWIGIAVCQLLVASVLVLTTRRQLRTTLPITEGVPGFSDHDLPAVTICVPARNETDALAACLESLLASDYPKLEVLVVDDCSQDKTSEVIKSFAHQGVRFIHGTPPTDEWLAKNWVYQQLYQQANGECILYCGVDVRLEPQSIRMMVMTALARHKVMLSFIPRNVTPPSLRPQYSTLLQPMRYAWELCLPRRFFSRPAVLSSCWLVQRDFLKQAGSFGAVSRTIEPERFLAQVAVRRDGYSFIQGGSEIAMTSQKQLHDQFDTAVRTRYPVLHRRPELVVLVSLLEFMVTVMPLVLFVVGIWQQAWWLTGLSLLGFVLTTGTYEKIVRLTYRQFLWRGVVALPVAAIADIAIRQYSMWQYEFSEVLWKGRNICLPVMQVYRQLPPINEKQ